LELINDKEVDVNSPCADEDWFKGFTPLMLLIVEGTPGHQNPLRGFQTPNPLPPFGEL